MLENENELNLNGIHLNMKDLLKNISKSFYN